MDLKLSYKNAERILEVEDGEVPYLRYPLLSDTGIVKHGFSTRLGGVSEGCYASMNLSFTRGDREHILYDGIETVSYTHLTLPTNSRV